MKNFLISASIDIIVILISYFIFRAIINGKTRHKMYEKLFSSFAKFVIFIFIATLIITWCTTVILHKTRYVAYINIIAPIIASIFIGFLSSTLPTRAVEDTQN